MAICKICGGEMLEHVGCKIGICNCNGKSYPRIIFGAEKRFEDVCGEAIYGDCECQLILPDLADMEEMLK